MMEHRKTALKGMFNSEHGFSMMEKWPAFARWLMVLPVAILSFLVIIILKDWIIKITTQIWFVYSVSFIFHTIATAIFIYYGAATAPKHRQKVMAVLSINTIFFLVAILAVPKENFTIADFSLQEKIIYSSSLILGILLVYNVWTKPLVREQVEM